MTTPRQKGFIRSLEKKYPIRPKASSELSNMTTAQASDYIDRLLKGQYIRKDEVMVRSEVEWPHHEHLIEQGFLSRKEMRLWQQINR